MMESTAARSRITRYCYKKDSVMAATPKEMRVSKMR